MGRGARAVYRVQDCVTIAAGQAGQPANDCIFLFAVYHIVMNNNTLGTKFLKELEMEAAASRKCLERIPADAFDWAPHEKSMKMGRLALIVAEIPRWIYTMVEDGEINFGTFKHAEAKTAADLLKEFDEGTANVKPILEKVSDETLGEEFRLMMGDKVLMSAAKGEMIGPTINHGVHHRGQLTVYMRLKNIAVPSIYGPSADEGEF